MRHTLIIQLMIGLICTLNGINTVYAQQSKKPQISNHSATLIPKTKIFSLEGQVVPLGSASLLITDGTAFANTTNFQGQFSSNHHVLSGNRFNTEQLVDVFGRIQLDKKNIGQTGEILRVVFYQGQLYMKTPTGWVPWDGQLSSLVAAEAPRAFKAIEDVEIEHNLTLAGDFNFYFGYRVNNQIFYNKQPLKLSLVDNTGSETSIEPPETAADLACDTPWGTILLSGASATSYQATSVNTGSTCVSEERLCSNGVLSGSYVNQTCAAEILNRVDVPQNINVNPIDGGVEISWDPVVYAASHNLYYSLNADFPESRTEKIENIQLPYFLTGLTNGETYYFSLTAINVAGNESNFSDEISSIPTIIIPPVKLNDTGMTYGRVYGMTYTDETCSYPNSNQQDCSHGRDVTHNDDSDGHAGFSFTKLDANGNDLTASVGQWSCVRDNVTGLIWEVKTDNGDKHDKDNTYRWGGVTALGRGAIGDNYYSDWNELVNGSNTETLCGYSDWRVPTRTELINLIDFSRRRNKKIDRDYFPNTASYVWSSSPYASVHTEAWYVTFSYGFSNGTTRNSTFQVRLVRSGQ